VSYETLVPWLYFGMLIFSAGAKASFLNSGECCFWMLFFLNVLSLFVTVTQTTSKHHPNFRTASTLPLF
jgi:hypothetical protein